jgi:UDP-N-acetyl-D-mannosaminuronate dehydrogenase
MKTVLLIGLGEVGSAIKRIEEKSGNDVFVQEINQDAPMKKYDVCHVNIPYSDKFIDIVVEYLKKFQPKLTIINATVVPGTTDIIIRKTNKTVVHSPIRGIHPHLYEGVGTFVKFIGGGVGDAIEAKKHFRSLGIETYNAGNTKNTEFAKILSTTYYGWNILFAKLINQMCDANGLDYNEVYTQFNQTYNEGYTKLGKKNVVRPVLFPPEGFIGGHCVSQNFELLPEGTLKTICKFLNETQELDKKNYQMKAQSD